MAKAGNNSFFHTILALINAFPNITKFNLSIGIKKREYNESGIHFTFDRHWVVKKYDQHTYFQGLSGAGLKGIDFIGIRQSRKLLLMEVKNFSSRPEIDQEPPITPYLDQPELLVNIFEEKVRDTLKAISAIAAYYQRNWSYRLSLPLIKKLPSSSIDRIFWTHANELLTQPTNLFLVLWLETDPEQLGLLSEIEPLLKERLSPLTGQVFVSSSQRPVFNIGLTTKTQRHKDARSE